MPYISDNASLFSEWNTAKNDNLDPTTITLGSNKKVWWKCKRGHQWQAYVSNRAKGQGCPYCSGRLAWAGENDLGTLYPDLASQWHPTKNGTFSPSQVRPGCNTKFWWICDKGHEWQDSPNHRVSGRGCPYCSHNRLLPDETLADLFPDVSTEWDYENNTGSPKEYAPYSNKKVSWICRNSGNRWEATISSRTNLKSGCPVCANQTIVPGENDLATRFPILAAEWDYEKNSILPSEVGAGSEKSVWWKCEFGHSWKARINNRAKGIGCPVCVKYRKTSFQEYAVYFYVKQAFPHTIHTFRSPELGRKEIDVFIPSCTVGIEYDGQNWHTSTKKDIEKDKVCNSYGITLIRIREPQCKFYERTDPTIILKDQSIESLQEAITRILQLIKDTETPIDLRNDYDTIIKVFRNTAIKGSLSVLYPELAKEWHPTLNAPLTPSMIPGTGSKEKYYWLCPVCGYSWKASLENRINGRGCPACAGRVVYEGYNDFASHEPVLSKEWHPNKNQPLLPSQVTRQSKKKVWWQCEKGH